MDEKGIVQITLFALVGVTMGILGIFGVHFGKRWVRREIARAFKELRPFQPASFTVLPTEESFSDDTPEG